MRCAETHPGHGQQCEIESPDGTHVGPHSARRNGGTDRWAPAGMTVDIRDDVRLT